jgi:hypothetical protein
MKHLTEEQLMRLVLDRSTFEAGEQRHLRLCSECGARHEELRQLAAYLCESWAVPPVSAWSRLRRRMERSRRPGRDWTEPRWLPLVAVHCSAVAITLGLILALGSWLGSSALWGRIGTLGFVSAIGPRGLVGLAFAVVGGLGVLAMMPILWWESRTRS